jgi:hypothetical protein
MFQVKWSALSGLLLPSAYATVHRPENVASVHARHFAQYLNLAEVLVDPRNAKR